MRNFFMGLALGILGAVLWIVASFLAAVGSLPEEEPDLFASPVAGSLVVMGFMVMFLGPIVCWLVLPVGGWLRRRFRSS